MTTTETPNARERIIAAAKHELHEVGILGMRVQEVAKLADTSVSLIYKYFEDRDGLHAVVLATCTTSALITGRKCLRMRF